MEMFWRDVYVDPWFHGQGVGSRLFEAADADSGSGLSRDNGGQLVESAAAFYRGGLITQGRYSQLVYRAMSVFEMPRRLYMMTETDITKT